MFKSKQLSYRQIARERERETEKENEGRKAGEGRKKKGVGGEGGWQVGGAFTS